MSRVCDSCGRVILDDHNTFLCDYPKGTSYACRFNENQTHSTLKVAKVTCDRELCQGCAIELWSNMHLCPKHARKVQVLIADAIWDLPPEAQAALFHNNTKE